MIFKNPNHISLNLGGHLMSLDVPKVMGILNVTPDSFFAGSRTIDPSDIKERLHKIVEEGADIIDIGGCSTRPGGKHVAEEEELKRVMLGCEITRELYPSVPLSIDTFRASVAGEAIDKWQADIINDVSGGADSRMFELIASRQVVYVLTHNPEEKLIASDVTPSTITWMAKKLHELRLKGVNDVILDPGFGFSKGLEDNFRLLANLEEFTNFGLPLLVGVSRKSMIYKSLGSSPDSALTGTVALNMAALLQGADILRVHDVKEAVETVKLYFKLKENSR